MKKFVKPLVIAASVAAIAGIGAVSFAAWNGGTASKNVSGGTTGHVDTTGFGSGSTASLTDKLMPRDQTGLGTGETTMYNIKLVVEGNDAADYKITGNYTAKKNGSDHTWESGSKLEYLIDNNATATYGTGTWTEWTASSTAADLVGGDSLTAKDYYVHVALTSEEAGDMDVVLAFAFELAKA